MNSRELVDSIKKKIVDSVTPKKIILFGSHAQGTAGPESDIDLLIVQNTNEDHHTRNFNIRRLFPRRKFSLDVFVFTPEEIDRYKSVKGSLIYTAFNQGKVLYDQQ